MSLSRMCPLLWRPCWQPRPRSSLSLEENPLTSTTLHLVQPSPPCEITLSLSLPVFHLPPSLLSSTNLNELAKAVRLLAALDVEGMTPDDLLRAARALANATAGLLNASEPENLEVRERGRGGGRLRSLSLSEPDSAVGGCGGDGGSWRIPPLTRWRL